jgi:hypothetical protein
MTLKHPFDLDNFEQETFRTMLSYMGFNDQGPTKRTGEPIIINTFSVTSKTLIYYQQIFV